jgi:hypothetical protein
MKKIIVLTFTLVVLFSVPLVGAADTPSGSLQEKKSIAVNFIRLINTAEMNYRHDHGTYATFADLVKSSLLEKTAARFEMFAPAYKQMNSESESEPLPGLSFGLVIAADGAKYKLSAQEKQKCGFAFFSDEGGLIFEGKVIDCPAK